MFKIISKIGAITTPSFIAIHLINQNKENRDKTSKYCPVIETTDYNIIIKSTKSIKSTKYVN